MALPLIALPGSGIEVVLGAPSPAVKENGGWNGTLAGSLASALTASGLARQRMQFPWTWLARLEDLPLPSPMITSLTAGGIVYALQLAEMLGRSVPLAPRVRERLEACCHQLGIDPGERAPAWWTENLDSLETAFGDVVRRRLMEHVAWELPLGAVQPALTPPAEPARARRPLAEPEWRSLPTGLAVPAMRRPPSVFAPSQPIDAVAGFSVTAAGTVQLKMAYALPLLEDDRAWLWQANDSGPTCYRISRAEEQTWWVNGVAGAHRVVGVSVERAGECLGTAFRSTSDVAEVVLAAEGWECAAAWLRWCRVPVLEGLVRRAVARRVKAEPEATLAAWLAPEGPEGLAVPGEAGTAELLQEFFGNWWASAEEADSILRAASLQGKDADAWVRLAKAHPALLGQILAAGWQNRPMRERKALLVAVCDRLSSWMVPEGRGGEVHWELAEQTALARAAAEWGVGEWMFTSSGQAGALMDWVAGRAVPPEMRGRWISAWASAGACQWTALHVVRKILATVGAPAERTEP
jgi:hypothetical protein